MDDILDEIEHQEFLDEMRRLVEDIAWALASAKGTPTKDFWDDIDVYGNEPVFASIVFDLMERE